MNVMNKMILIGIGVVIILVMVSGSYYVQNQTDEFVGTSSEPIPPITQQDLRKMIDEWMNNPDDDTSQRLEIMKAYYTFEESGQKLTDDQEGRVMLNQIRKMISFDIPKTELDQIKEGIKEELRGLGFKIDS